ncbi:Kinesin-like protein KIN-14S [Vitis vinifera]|uniref:Kinesin-like protein KIN-14S n=1 Tax=Vitis vinifera TaxID=29760 RepID=A0A438C8T3_VITVI|nr:Kinesin-like protein KIN-14S [Vitis vinifera]
MLIKESSSPTERTFFGILRGAEFTTGRERRETFLETVKGHTILCNEVRSINADSSPGPEVYNALLFLGMSSLLATTDILYPSSRGALIEGLEQKRLYNEVIQLRGNIRVFYRCRPLNQAEMANGSTSIVDFESSRENELQIICSNSSKKQFKFDHVFRPGSDQEAVFAQTSPIVTSMLDGYNDARILYEVMRRSCGKHWREEKALVLNHEDFSRSFQF